MVVVFLSKTLMGTEVYFKRFDSFEAISLNMKKTDKTAFIPR